MDVARALGCSVQLVRDLEAQGVLPAADRADSGYRRYTESHVNAGRAYRAFAAGMGPVAAKVLLRAFHRGEVETALALLDSAHAQLHHERSLLEQTRSALDHLAAEPVLPTRPADAMGITELADALGMRPSALRHWEAEGLLTADRQGERAARRYSPEHVRDARVVHQLRAAGYRIPTISRLLPELRRAGRSARVAAALGDRESTLTNRSKALLDGAACLSKAAWPSPAR
ncbi:MerR family transcriptional regulator [Modestobacter sp. VKM Ac-2985]|nr:MerR family transcriptional regulator [Modestobacter sp. VKM Ac-2985]MCZ2837695.1 MerR family transcriptional regulator [Modestobacter sp. VKM Ac-2985]